MEHFAVAAAAAAVANFGLSLWEQYRKHDVDMIRHAAFAGSFLALAAYLRTF